MQTAPGEVYTALERGVVDGYGWPMRGIFDLNWQEKTKYHAGFPDAEVSLIANLDMWKRLQPRQREHLAKQARALEGQNNFWKTYTVEETKRHLQWGIEVIRFEGPPAQQYLDKAYEAAWASVLKASPEHGPRVRELRSPRNSRAHAQAGLSGAAPCRGGGGGAHLGPSRPA